MSDEVKKALSGYLLRLLESLEKGINWTADQIPLVIQEKLAWEFWIHAVYLGFGVALLLVGLGCIVKARLVWLAEEAKSKDSYKHNGHYGHEAWLFGIAPFLSGFPITAYNLEHLIQITVAPRLYIIEWLRGTL